MSISDTSSAKRYASIAEVAAAQAALYTEEARKAPEYANDAKEAAEAAASSANTASGYVSSAENASSSAQTFATTASDKATKAEEAAVSAAQSADDASGAVEVGINGVYDNLSSQDVGKGAYLSAFKQPQAGSLPRTLQEKGQDIISRSDFADLADLVNAVIDSGSQAFNVTDTFTITVGSGGMFTSLSSAISTAVKIRPTWKSGNGFCEIKLLSGYILNEQISFDGGQDLSWIKITSVDSVVFADTTSFTLTEWGYYQYKYMFYSHGATKPPVFSIQIEENRTNSDVCCFLATQGSYFFISPYSGARKFLVGAHIVFGSGLIGLHRGGVNRGSGDLPSNYYLGDFSYCIKASLEIMEKSSAYLPLSYFTHCQCVGGLTSAVVIIYGSVGNFLWANASYASVNGWIARDGARLLIREHTTINCGGAGLYTVHGVFVDARNHNTDEATTGPVTNPSIQDGFYGCATAISADGPSIIEAQGTDMRNCGLVISANRNANINVTACDVSNSTQFMSLFTGVNLSCARLHCDNVAWFGQASYGCFINTWTSYINGPSASTSRYADIRTGSQLVIYSTTWTSSTGLVATDGSRIIVNGNSMVFTVPLFSAQSGSEISLNSFSWVKTYVSGNQLTVSGGSRISATAVTNSDSSTVTSNVTKNAWTAAGAVLM